MKTRGLLLLLCALAGCSVLAPRPDPSRFYVLSPLPVTASDGARPELALGLGPIKLPGYLRQAEIATRVAPNQVQFAAFSRWAEPLDVGIGRVLATDLAALLGTERIAVFPWFDAFEPTWVIELDMQQFEQTADGTVRLLATWAIRESPGKSPVAVRETALSEPAAAVDTAAATAALSKTLATLAREMADVVRTLPSRQPKPPPRATHRRR